MSDKTMNLWSFFFTGLFVLIIQIFFREYYFISIISYMVGFVFSGIMVKIKLERYRKYKEIILIQRFQISEMQYLAKISKLFKENKSLKKRLNKND